MQKVKTVLALGYFDGVHIGHRAVIEKAKEVANNLDCSLTVLTFRGDLRSFFNKNCLGQIYTYSEKEDIIKEFSDASIFGLPTTVEFLKKTKKEFLDFLNEKFNVSCYVSGQDYKFGCDFGDIEFLKQYAKEKSQRVFTVSPVLFKGEKISSSVIKKLLQSGDVKCANALLKRDYSIKGEVFKDRAVGRNLGFPTANIRIDENKALLRKGVYKGYAIINGKKYLAVINYGDRPTFSVKGNQIEAHFINFNGTLYGETLTVYFTDYIREIKKFSCEKELCLQIQKDVLSLKEF